MAATAMGVGKAKQHPKGFPQLTVNTRVRPASNYPETKPTATIIEVGDSSVTLAWDDGYEPTSVLRPWLNDLKVL